MSFVLIDNISNKTKSKLLESIISIDNRHKLYRKFGYINGNDILTKTYGNDANIDTFLKKIFFENKQIDLSKAEDFYNKYSKIFNSQKFDSIDDIYNTIGSLLNDFKNSYGKYYNIKKPLNGLMLSLIIQNDLLLDFENGEPYDIYYKSLEKIGVDYKKLLKIRNEKFGKIPKDKLNISSMAIYLTDMFEKKKLYDSNKIDNPRKFKNILKISIINIENKLDLNIYNIYKQLDKLKDSIDISKFKYINSYIDLLKSNEKAAKDEKEKLYNIQSIKDIFLHLIDNEYKPKLDRKSINILKDIYEKSDNKELKNIVSNILENYSKNRKIEELER